MRAVAKAHINEPEVVTKRVTRQTTQSKGKQRTIKASDDDESVAWPFKHPRSAKNTHTNESSPAQQPRATKTTSLPSSTHSMARRSKFVNGTFFHIKSSLCTAVMHFFSQLLRLFHSFLMSLKDLPTISEIGSHLDGEPLHHPKQLRSAPKEKPAAEDESPPEYHPSPTTFLRHDNRYDSDSVQSGCCC